MSGVGDDEMSTDESTATPTGAATGESTADESARERASARFAGRDGWRAHRPADDGHLGSLWIRWTDGGTDLHLHRICEVVPQVSVESAPPYVSVVPETGERPTFVPVRDEEPGASGDGTAADGEAADGEAAPDPIQFRFVDGLPRQLLRHVPLVVLVALLALVVGAEFTPGVRGLGGLLPTVAGPHVALFGVFLLISPVMLWLFSTVGVVEHRELPRAAVVYGLLIVLTVGVGASILLAMLASHPRETPPNVVFVSGYLLVLLVGGQLLYEATLRIEHLLVKLGAREGDIVENERAYRRFLTDLHDGLQTSVFGLSPSRLFGVLFAAQFAIIWVIGDGPQTMGYGLGLVVNTALNAVLATIVFQFLVVVRYFNNLLNATDEYADVGLTYQPFHVDGRGGFRDLGRFATRINIILTLGGLYLVYRLYVIGARGLPTGGLDGFTDPVLMTVWLISFAGPVVAYALGALAWGYYSFWTMHTKMVRDKHDLARRYQGTTSRPGVDRTPAAGDGIESFDDSKGPAWAALVAAPTWPLDVGKMVSLISGNALPLILPASNVLF
jgi:hypothetical protein